VNDFGINLSSYYISFLPREDIIFHNQIIRKSPSQLFTLLIVDSMIISGWNFNWIHFLPTACCQKTDTNFFIWESNSYVYTNFFSLL